MNEPKFYIIDAEGKPHACESLDAWARQWSEDMRRVAFDAVGDAQISTVFLGIDHNWLGGDPILYETMIFRGPHDQHQERYTTREDALVGHAAAVKLAREASALTTEHSSGFSSLVTR